jgi:probable HAF family extracellular repeat protein
LPGGSDSHAQGINNLGQIVGVSTVSTLRAFLWTETSGMIDLNDAVPSNSGWVLQDATAITDNGYIAGYGINPQGRQHGFILLPL